MKRAIDWRGSVGASSQGPKRPRNDPPAFLLAAARARQKAFGQLEEEEEEVLPPVRKVTATQIANARKQIVATPLAGASWKKPVAAASTSVASARQKVAAAAVASARQKAAVAAAKAASARQQKLVPFQRCFVEEAEIAEDELASIEAAREEMEITVACPNGTTYPLLNSFTELDVLPDYVTTALVDMDFYEPMPIQKQALPIVLGGHDLVGIAKTGSGKTLAFLLPAIVHIEAQQPVPKNSAVPIALILAPTRELAVQICDEAKKLVANSEQGNHPGGLTATCIYGGRHRQWQVDEVRQGCHILVATPGRLIDFIDNDVVSLRRTTYFVLDEADRMLDFGFADDVKKIGSKVRTDRHMLFFSATWPNEVRDFAKKMCLGGQEPVHISVGQKEDGTAATREDIVQEVVVFDQDEWEERNAAKTELLYAHLREQLQDEAHKILVFVSSKIMADELASTLVAEGFDADAMHGGRSQDVRLDVLEKFRKGFTRLLVATDVMGRGLDIPDISHIVIFDMGDVDDYVHRIGRTARGPNGHAGHTLTFFEYNAKWPEIAGDLVKVLVESAQEVPEELTRIAEEVEAGTREIKDRDGRSNGRSRNKFKKNWSGDDWGKKESWKKDSWKQKSW